MSLTGYLAPVGFDHEVRDELAAAGRRLSHQSHGRLLLSADDPLPSVWAANVWHDVEQIPITSIGHAAKELRQRQRNWALYAPVHGGRARLIADKLPSVSARPAPIGGTAPDAPLGSWTLLEPDLLLAARECSSPFPNGEVTLVENRQDPPSRAYLKLFESFVRLRRWPSTGETCLDLGASPGGWTWLLAQTAASVVAVDKAALSTRVERLPGVSWQQGSAFALDPSEGAPVDWLCSDIVCYPQRLLGLVHRWIEADAARNIVCTIKFQGVTDQAVVREFQAIPGGRVLHLHHNRHELTFIRAQPEMP